MSYEIYKSIKQLPDGTFECISASSNCTDMNGNRDFTKWIMDFFVKKFPGATLKELRACWLVYSNYSSDRFYQSNWKADQQLASKFFKEKGYSYDIFRSNTPDQWYECAKEFLKYKHSLSFTKKKSFIVSMNFNSGREYVSKLTSKRASAAYSKSSAKIFKAYDITDVENLFKGYSSYSPIVEELTNEGE